MLDLRICKFTARLDAWRVAGHGLVERGGEREWPTPIQNNIHANRDDSFILKKALSTHGGCIPLLSRCNDFPSVFEFLRRKWAIS